MLPAGQESHFTPLGSLGQEVYLFGSEVAKDHL